MISDTGHLCTQPPPARAIIVPYTVPASGHVEISNLADGQVIELEPGPYALLCEMGTLPPSNPDEAPWWDRCWCRLTFTREAVQEPHILVVDEEMRPSYPLLMDAEPA